MEEIKQLLERYPYLTYLIYGGNEYVGIIQNADEQITTIYDFAGLKTPEQKIMFLELGDTWWWESNRQFPISIFCKDQLVEYQYIIKTFNSKDTRIILGPVVNLMDLSIKRVKRK